MINKVLFFLHVMTTFTTFYFLKVITINYPSFSKQNTFCRQPKALQKTSKLKLKCSFNISKSKQLETHLIKYLENDIL